MNYCDAFFDEPIDRRNTACEKWDGLMAREGRELNPMWVADMDFHGVPEVTDALVARANHPVYGYTDQTDASVEAMLAFMERRHHLKLNAKQQALLPCVISGLRAAVLALTEPGDHVIIQPPVYGPFAASVLENGRLTAEAPLLRDESGRYHMDWEAIESRCREGAKLMLLCNPHNPVGRCWTCEELTRLYTLLSKYDVALISDEIHEDFVFEKDSFTPILHIAQGENARVAALTSASKTFNLAGLQQAVLFTRNLSLKNALVNLMHRVGVVQGNIFGLAAAEAAYRHGDAWLDGLLSYVKKAEQLTRAELAARLPKAVLSPLEATYLGWMDLRAYGYTTEELMKRTYAAGVAFTPGTFFGEKEGEGFLRINLACPHSQTLDAIKRLEKAIKG
ncbi:MAG: PatB family C-S lyase [Clostridia bacterium]